MHLLRGASLLALVIVTCWVGALSARRPNIVLLVADDLGYGELGCQGNAEIPTPHIDSIAAEGIRFTDGYVTASYCSASRAGLLSGRYQTRFGYEFNPIGAQNEDPRAGLPESEVTLARHLHDAGYTTALIGKWHLGGHARYHPHRRGFDEFFGFTHEGHYFVPPPYRGVTTMLRRKRLPNGGEGRWTRNDGTLVLSTHMRQDEPAYDADNPIVRDGQPVAEPAYLTDAFTREAVDFIGRNTDRPFFLYLAYNAVHSPLQGADRYMQRFRHIEDIHRRIFAAMLSNLDDSVGAVLSKLRDESLWNDTLVFFISDNGGPTRELTSSNLPLRGGKGDVYEGGIRVPYLIQWPGRLPRGATYRHPVVSLDVYATAAEVAGAPIPSQRPIDGANLLPYLTDRELPGFAGNPGAPVEDRPHPSLYWRLNRRTAFRVGDWKLVRNPRRSDNASWQMFDLSVDISEKKDLYAEQPQRAAQLLAAWQQLDDEMVEPIWSPR
jgi:arylsulfatase A-like enzyme